ncbi:MAG TPA: glycoside hydrolase family 2 TIM barrel-domain containing protein [Candidatus Didemnitutus sp.]|jgi:beta-galactosidase
MLTVLPLDRSWLFRRIPPAGAPAESWSTVDLPHCPFVADLDGRSHWFGECEYQRTVTLPAETPAGRIALGVGAAMHSATIAIDGVPCGVHAGGYLPFEVDLPPALRDGQPHTLTLRLDNRDNPEVPPGKAYADLDFCWYGGLYRDVVLRCYPELHFPDPVACGLSARGGLLVRTLAASPASARLSLRATVANSTGTNLAARVEFAVLDGERIVAAAAGAPATVSPGVPAVVETELEVPDPRLWQPDHPALYHLHATLVSADGAVLDRRIVRFGIRRIRFSRAHGFEINGRRHRLRGTNRHQDHPYVGYAVPPAAQWRDARRIKEAGFDYVRLSHYPQSPDFLDACDELGLVVMNCIPGWQFMGGEKFRSACEQNARDLVRRDRNHPCVVLWELSLNETEMDEPFMARLHAIGHEELPGDQMFTCGWQDRYDVFIRSRQHGQIHEWVNGDKALVIAEYGDWEFYATTSGLDQRADPPSGNAHTRQRRSEGERGLRQQAQNHQSALNDTLASPAVLDGQWSMFDYPRGYDPVRAACGVMDVFRLPKFSYYFYRSQRGPKETGERWTGGSVVFIASHWTADSDLAVPVFTNCEEIELRLNGLTVARSGPDRGPAASSLPHPPCIFELPVFQSGTLHAIGYIGGKPVGEHRVSTPGDPARLNIEFDAMSVAPAPGASDLLIAHARIEDAAGNLCVGFRWPINFVATGDGILVGPSSVAAEAGVASILLRLNPDASGLTLQARHDGAAGIFVDRRELALPHTGVTPGPAATRLVPAERFR